MYKKPGFLAPVDMLKSLRQLVTIRTAPSML